MKKVLIIYFSACGGTEGVARETGYRIKNPQACSLGIRSIYDVDILDANGAEITGLGDLSLTKCLEGYDCLGFCSPVWELHFADPLLDLARRINKLRKPMPAFAVMTMSGLPGNAGRNFAKIIKRKNILLGAKCWRQFFAPATDIPKMMNQEAVSAGMKAGTVLFRYAATLRSVFLSPPGKTDANKALNRLVTAVDRMIVRFEEKGRLKAKIPRWKIHSPLLKLLQKIYFQKIADKMKRQLFIGKKCLNCNKCSAWDSCPFHCWIKDAAGVLEHNSQHCTGCQRCVDQCAGRAIVSKLMVEKGTEDNPRVTLAFQKKALQRDFPRNP